jgi:endonuclease-3
MSTADVEIFFERLQQANPNPETELNYRSHFELLIAVLLSAQSTDIAVNKVTPALFELAPDAHAMAKLEVAQIEELIKTLGLYRSKAKHALQTAQIISLEHQGAVPRDRAMLERLPGVGRKTANVVLNTAFGEPTMAVDTHIERVSNRTGLAPGKTVLAVELRLLKRTPKPYLQNAHHWLILHGRYICKARKPVCDQCPVYDVCRFKGKEAIASA